MMRRADAEYTLHDIYRKIGLMRDDLLRDLAVSLLHGSHRSVYKGKGPIFHRIKQFDPERDDSKDIVWRLTDPDGTHYVRQCIKAKEFTLITLADLSHSTRFCLELPRKEMMLLEIMGVLGLTCARDRDKFGCIGFSEDVIYHEYPQAGQDNLYYLLDKIYQYFQTPLEKAPSGSSTDLQRALSFLLEQYEGDSLVVVITDFIGCEPILNSNLLSRVRALHDLVFLILDDPEEFEGFGGGLGYVPLKDPEQGDIVDVSRSRNGIADIKADIAEDRARLQSALKAAGIDSAVLTPGNHVKELIKLFHKRRAA